jgi:hypothetical protein
MCDVAMMTNDRDIRGAARLCDADEYILVDLLSHWSLVCCENTPLLILVLCYNPYWTDLLLLLLLSYHRSRILATTSRLASS